MAQPVEPPVEPPVDTERPVPPRPDLDLEEFEEVVEEPVDKNPMEPDRPVGTPVKVTVKVPLKEDWG